MASTDCPEAEVSGEIVVILTFEVSQIKTSEWGGGRIGRDKVVYRGSFVDQPNAPRRTKRTRPFQPHPRPRQSLSSVYTLEAIVYAGLNETINLGLHLAFFSFCGLSFGCKPQCEMHAKWFDVDFERLFFFFFFTGRDEDRVYIR